MSNIFEPVAGDLSMQYLEQIFGTVTVGGLLPANAMGGPVSVLGVMFQTFNTIILSIASIIIIYMTVMGVLMSAHEGEFMKKWNSLWAPLRAVLGVATLFPTATGYSSLQVMMMWVIINGVGAADQLWGTALKYVNTMGSVYAQGGTPTAGIKNTFLGLFKSLACETSATFNMSWYVSTLNNIGNYYCFMKQGGSDQDPSKNPDPFCMHYQYRQDFNLGSQTLGLVAHNDQVVELDQIYQTPGIQTFGPQGGCGKLYYCDIRTSCLKQDGTNLWSPSLNPVTVAAQNGGNIVQAFEGYVAAGGVGSSIYSDVMTTSRNSIEEFIAKLQALSNVDPNDSAAIASVKNGQAIAASCYMCATQILALGPEIYTLRNVAMILSDDDYNYTYSYYNGYSGSGDPSIPTFAKNYCNAKAVSSNQCFGQIGYSYKDVQQQQSGQDTTSDTSASATQGNFGALPDAKLGSDGPSMPVITDVIWPYDMEGKIWQPNLTPAQNALVNDPVANATNDYIHQLDLGAQYLQTYVVGYTHTGAGPNPNSIALTGDQATRNQISAILNNNLSNPGGGASIFATAYNQGWIAAGGYYYFLVRDNGNRMSTLTPRLNMLSINPASANDESGYSDIMKDYRNNYAAASVLAKLMANDSPTSLGGGNMDSFNDAGQAAQASLVNATDSSSQTNPLIQVASQGYTLLRTAQIIFAAFLLLSFTIGLVSGISFSVLGTGFTNPLAVAFPVIMGILTPLMGMCLGIMVTTGATLCVYVPLIPYMIFTFGAVGWLIATVEAMVAGPIIALGIIAPGGHSELLGKAEPALMLLFGTFIRPSLMIFGLIASMLISCVAVQLVNQAFWPLVFPQVASLAKTGGASISASLGNTAAQFNTVMQNPLMAYFFLMAYVGIIVAVLNKSFAAIHIIPERVMRWLGAQGDSYGEAEAAGSVKQGIDSEAGKIGKSMGERGEGAGHGAKNAMREGKAEAKKKQAASKPSTGATGDDDK